LLSQIYDRIFCNESTTYPVYFVNTFFLGSLDGLITPKFFELRLVYEH
jgi:hypothetical protein